MRFAVFGLGSMGKRRIRCLQALEHKDIIGYDTNAERREEAERLYGIETVETLEGMESSAIDAFVVSTPPDKHLSYIKLALEYGKPAFIEASVILKGLEELNIQAKEKKVVIAPSCTMRFHPAIKDIKEIVTSGKYGKITNFTHHSGQYLPDWHPWEEVKDYYVSRKETGGGREIVPFELSWMVDLLGFPEDATGFYGKTMDVGADIDDTYAISLKFAGIYGTLLVDVASRYAVRSLIINLETAQLVWRWDEGEVKLYEAENRRWIHYRYAQGQGAAEGYNKNIVEEMYIDEVAAFVKAAVGKGDFPNSLEDDIKVLQVLEKVEKSHGPN